MVEEENGAGNKVGLKISISYYPKRGIIVILIRFSILTSEKGNINVDKKKLTKKYRNIYVLGGSPYNLWLKKNNEKRRVINTICVSHLLVYLKKN